jgi:ammonium transporter Rh
MTIIELVFYAFNEYIVLHEIGAADIGASMIVHMFGAVFGLAVSYVIGPKNAGQSAHCGDSYNSNLIAMIGTLFLFIYWPSFNAGFVTGE